MRIRTARPSGIHPRVLRRAGIAVAAAALACAPVAVTSTVAPPTAQAAPSDSAAPEFLSLSVDSVTPQVVDRTSANVVTVHGTVRNVGDRTVSDVQVRMQRSARVTEADGVRSVLSLDQSSYGTVGPFHEVTDSLDAGESQAFTVSLPVNDQTRSSLNITEPGVYPLLVNVNGTPDYGGPARLDDARFLLPVNALPPSAEPGAGNGAGNTGKSGAPSEPSPEPVPVTMLYPLAADPSLAAGLPGASYTDDATTGRLVSDALASSLSPGGRLDGMVSALSQALDPHADPDGTLATGLCLAIDPDLLVTVDTMARGYAVTDDPADPTADTTTGSGQAAAADWLARLRGLASRTCTVPLPYAQADLDAVRDLASPEATASALRDPADIVDRILGVTSVRDVVWPAVGQMTPATAATLPGTLAPPESTEEAPDAPPPTDPPTPPDATVPPTVLLADTAVDPAETSGPGEGTSGSGRGSRSAAATGSTERSGSSEPSDTETARISAGPGTDVDAVLFDSPTATALAAAGSSPGTPSFVPESLRYDLDHDSRTARLQDALGAVAWPILHSREQAASAASAGGSGRSGTSGTSNSDTSAASGETATPLVLAPPQNWGVDHDEASAVLNLLRTFYDNGAAVPRPLNAAITDAHTPDTPRGELTDPMPGDGIAEIADPDSDGTGSDGTGSFDDAAENPEASIPPERVDRLHGLLPHMATVRGMLAGPGHDGESPDQYMTPLHRDMLRALSTAGRDGDTEAAQAAEAASQDRATALDASITDQLDAVTVLAPGSVYTLASSQSPLLVVATNDLPMPVRVRLEIQAPQGVQINNADDYILPARGSRQIQVPAEIEFSRQIDLRVRLLAPDSVPVGEQVHISLHSNAYGMVIPVVTGVSGALLLFLAGRRGWHRLRGQHDPADERASERGPVLEQYRQDPSDQGPGDEG